MEQTDRTQSRRVQSRRRALIEEKVVKVGRNKGAGEYRTG